MSVWIENALCLLYISGKLVKHFQIFEGKMIVNSLVFANVRECTIEIRDGRKTDF